MFELKEKEFKNLRSHFVTSSWGGIRYPPMVFTEQGVAMLSGILKSKVAVEVNITIMRTFVKMRRILESHRDLAEQLVELEKRIDKHDDAIKMIFETIHQLMEPPERKKKQIGFKIGQGK